MEKMFTLEAIRFSVTNPAELTMSSKPIKAARCGYAVMSNGETVAIALKKVGAWELWPNVICGATTPCCSFKTIHELHEWLSSDQPTKHFKV